MHRALAAGWTWRNRRLVTQQAGIRYFEIGINAVIMELSALPGELRDSNT
jgi:hypothetical protein